MIYIIDGANFSNLEEFWNEIERIFAYTIPSLDNYKRSFAGLRNLLSNLPKGSAVIWQNSRLSLKRLGYSETVKLLRETQTNCHPSWSETIKKEIELAQLELGETVFDSIVKIFVEESVSLRLE